jgi:hypothetical protein
MSENHPLAVTMAKAAMRDASSPQRGYIRWGMGDAAHLCDAIAFRIGKTGRKSKRRDEMAAVAKQCGDAIWAMRDLVEVHREPTKEPTDA